MELFDTMTVRENVSLGREIRLAGGRWSRRLFSAPAEQAECIERAGRAIDDCGLTHLSDRLVGDLSTGQRRLVELARALAGGFRLFLLDEPSSGLDATETRRFGELLAKVVERDRVGILLVEHDMTLVRSVCTYVYVLDFGKLIYEGTVVEVTQSDIVKAAYLGSALARTD
jgi:ABC-type branched-subunit amino acid transport system ATPase component